MRLGASLVGDSQFGEARQLVPRVLAAREFFQCGGAIIRAGPALAALIFTLACGSVSATPELDEARHAYERGLFPAAHNKLLAAAYYGDASAQELLGFMYALGPHLYPGIKQDFVSAGFWLSRAVMAVWTTDARRQERSRTSQQVPVQVVPAIICTQERPGEGVMVGTVAGAVCAGFVLYGGWVVLGELLHRARLKPRDCASSEILPNARRSS